ncbi:ThiF family adenylyltransferase [Haliea sp. E17]|uniref:ThiF family adenylyltransferase n=1 Tax=Haliea sp. E17 TaxID=3401576 RepID=UPI003AAEDBF1
MSDTQRYSRQTRLPDIGEDGQQRLGAARVLVVGVGGLGLPAAAYLAGAGVGHITLVDHDVVELHNLHRQVFYREEDIGAAKVAAAARHLRGLNSAISITACRERLRDANVATLVAEHDLVLDTADNFTVTYLLSDSCLAAGKQLVYAALLGQRGQLGVFCGTAPSYRAVFPEVPAAAGNCESNGVLGTAVGALGAMQAQEAIKLLVASRSALTGKLLTVDFWHNRFATLDFQGAAEPGACTRIPLLASVDLRSTDQLVDVRSDPERATDAVEGALHLPGYLGDPAYRELLPQAGRLVFFCASGVRAQVAARRCAELHPGAEVAVLLRD